MLGRPTLKQVSEHAGVSIFTASRALTDGEGVSKETRERVREIASRLGYIPNRMARNFRTAASNFVGFLTANSENQFYVGLIAAWTKSGSFHALKDPSFAAELDYAAAAPYAVAMVLASLPMVVLLRLRLGGAGTR